MAYRRGDVIAVPYEYSDLTGGKIRPAVIISSDAYNLAQPDIVVAGISTQIHKANAYVMYSRIGQQQIYATLLSCAAACLPSNKAWFDAL